MKQYENRNWLYTMYIEKNLSQKSIAEICGINQTIIHRRLVRFNIPRRKFCGRAGKYSSNWKGGTYKNPQGYIFVLQKEHPRSWKTKPYVPEQILIAEKYLGRYLLKAETIHHLNNIKNDNRIENLYLFPNESKHQQYHQNLRRKNILPITKSNLFSKNG